ncbi:hypothetical protein Pcinc_032946 [Petrolisthes cinctipes]|uniref:Uncharacterized protein n=1 Tax=Petrolisthes cinctipes TaxID=88211 RepID=A0AAE1ETG5_PETCI|nr:hypothetical protein Pcinc_032946 [Petrolisthes cinctipes]
MDSKTRDSELVSPITNKGLPACLTHHKQGTPSLCHPSQTRDSKLVSPITNKGLPACLTHHKQGTPSLSHPSHSDVNAGPDTR